MSIESQSIKELSLALIEASTKIAERDERIAELEDALSRIYKWDEISLKDRIDIGSDGQKAYYRSIARTALNNKLKQLSGEG